jgi:hypothetical protein
MVASDIFSYMKIIFYILGKKLKKYSDAANYLSHKCEKNMLKYFVFWGIQK